MWIIGGTIISRRPKWWPFEEKSVREKEKEITICNKNQKKKKTNAYLKRAFRENALQSNKGPSRSVMCV